MAQTLGSVAVGSIVKIDENGSPVNYIVVHIGNPDVRLYGSACDGAWLLRQDIVENVQWNSTNANILAGSTIMSTMAGYLGRYESHIQSAIKTVKIPYHPGNGEPFWNIKSGENGLECKLFPLGGYEVGLSDPSGIMPTDGAKLDYFKSGLDTEANSKRIAKLNGAAAAWWLRSPVSLSTDGKFYILPDGSLGSTTVNPSYGALPAMIMDPTILVSDDGTVGVPASPTALNVPIQVMQGRQITVSWSAVDGASSYILERKANTDADWVQVYSGANTSFEETVGTWTSVQYRVKSLANGKYGDYTTSTSVSVVPLSALVISGSDGSLGTLTNDVQYSVSSSGTSVLTVTETINGVNTRTFTATNGAENKISVVDLPTGMGTVKITASTNPGSGVVSVTREWTYTKTAPTFANAGSTAQLQQNGKNIFPLTLLECVRGLENINPTKYGLGSNAATIPGNDLNNAISGGFYAFSSAVQNIPSFKSGKVLVMPYTSLQYYTQIAFAALTSEIAMRFCNDGNWGPWEYLNPLLSVGVEYRTVERYNGKPVYIKAINFGALPNNANKSVEHGVEDMGICFELFGNSSPNSAPPIGVNLIGDSRVTEIYRAGNVIYIGSHVAFQTSSAIVVMKYTKTTD
ncbi:MULTISPECIES: DUF6273 domain-containing protein [unclassified Oscillibacter]|uniref:DUF6273 domain-containing protein n=1 Tax=unclassified Oscillibacter TaxID=2629304 RepID=UPI0003AD778C|nr:MULTISPECIES: DUF6273 domain-containing protein [unclassified Oscillibacter]ERK63022.1 hypothetical protein HMPREF1546_02368 [Oscillibacter sp. KLE 1745]ERK65092.1 hypothetical protein HMPREF1545_00064 [Oscillibacter sp. KLE 1728]